MVKYAKAYLQRNYCSFVGTGHSFGFVKKEGKRIARAYKKGELFAGANARFRRVQIFNRKAEKLISLLDNKEALFYCDPPYPQKRQDAYSVSFTYDDFKALFGILLKIQGKWLLSCYKENISALNTNGLYIYEIGKSFSFNFSRPVQWKAHEVLLTNYKPSGQVSFF